jgi:hypothetical protein
MVTLQKSLEMIRSESKKKELSVLLRGNNNLVIAQGIDQLREEEPFEGALELLVSFFDTCNDQRIRKTINNFLCDIKDKDVRQEIMAELKKPLKPDTITMLISSCWQSGLDYSDYVSEFIKLFLASDYVTAIECLTVIEESAENLETTRRNELISILNKDAGTQNSEKKGLTAELVDILAGQS